MGVEFDVDLIEYGLIPEFVGRLPMLLTTKQLDLDDMLRVLTEPKNALLKQYSVMNAFPLPVVSKNSPKKNDNFVIRRVIFILIIA